MARWAPYAPAGCAALDLACGQGRHVRLLHQLGYAVHAVDRDPAAMNSLRNWLLEQGITPEALAQRLLCHDLEAQPWPFEAQRFGLIVVSRYLWRPLLPKLLHALDNGGYLLYETFTQAQATLGSPRNPDFLLTPGELLRIATQAQLEVIAYEDGYDVDGRLQPEPAAGKLGSTGGQYLQRVAARRPSC
mgnify:CR=1 FL=1